MEKFECSITGETYFQLKGTIADDKPIREFSYGDGKIGLNVSALVPVDFFGKKRIRRLDLVCFNELEQQKILKKKFKAKDKVVITARKTERGLALDTADDILKP